MSRRPRRHPGRDPRTPDLFDWQPPAMLRAFPAERIRAAGVRASVAKAIGLALRECGRTREQVADEIGAYLGEDISKNMLDAYASESRADHVINIVRFLALVHATRDFRLLQLLAEPFGLAVIDDRYLPAIEDAMYAEQIETLSQRQRLARRRWRGVQ